MALALDELEAEWAEALPARQVMSSIGSAYRGPWGNAYEGGIATGWNVQDVDIPIPLAPPPVPTAALDALAPVLESVAPALDAATTS